MPQPSQVLIVEDEQGSSRLIASLCEEVGLSSRTTGSGSEAIALARQAARDGQPFACMVVDLVLAEADGFQVAQAVRGETWGAELPIVVVSGIYKQLPGDFSRRVRLDGFLPKPFEPSRLRESLRKLCGAPAPQAPSGDLANKPVAQLLVELFRRRASGVLTIEQEGSTRSLTFQGGVLRFAQGTVPSELAGSPQVAQGLIKKASLDRARAAGKQQGIALHEALAAARVLSPEQLKAALRQQTLDVALGALQVGEGTYRFEELSADRAGQVPDARANIVLVILEWAKRHGNRKVARAFLEQRSADRMVRAPELERELFSVKSIWPGESVTALAAAGKTVAEALGRVKDADLPLLHALCLAGLVLLSSPQSAKAAPQSPEEEDRGRAFTPREAELRRFLFAERDRLAACSHYELLEIPRDAAPESIKEAFFRAAKRYHSDVYAGLDLGSARRVAEELFARVNEASAVLSDPKRRGDYEVYLDRKAKGLPTDVGAILRAESIFQRGEALFKAGKWDEAEAAFREAIGLNHAEAEFHAYLGMAIYRTQADKAEAAIEHVLRALDLDERLLIAQVFLARLRHALGETETAKKLLRKVLEQDPENAEARSELSRIRAAQQPAADAKKGGILGRLLKKP